MKKINMFIELAIGLVVALSMLEMSFAQTQPAEQTQPTEKTLPTKQTQPAEEKQRPAEGQQSEQRPQSRRSQRVVRMKEVQVVSPDGKVKFTLLPNAERLSFTVAMGDTTVIEPSPLVLNLDGYDLSSGVVVGNLEHYKIDETYPWYGTNCTAVNQCNGVKISLTHDLSYTDYTLEIRAFNDGVAYRHVIPGDESVSRVPDEYSTFIIPAGSTVWYAGMDGHYEADYLKKDISEIQPGQWAGPPLTLKLPDGAGYTSIAEANLVNYSGMGLEADGRRGWIIGLGHRQPLNYPFELRYGREEGKRLGKPASIKGTITTPWRVVMVGRDLNTLVNSTILPNLCPPPDPALFPEGIKTAWIKPGRAVWRYVDGGPTGVDGMKEFSRLAGELGFEHHVIEGIWSRWTMEERKDVVDYSRKQGVGVWFWKHSRQLRTPEAREEFFKMLHDLGVTGAKIDFFDHEAKEIVDVYEAILQKAAEYHILLVFHGANKPTGRERTWPNEMVREAIRGMEASRFMERARHQTILPFTRYLAGPADYTTMVFNVRRRDSSCAHQIASLAVFASPLLTIAANPQSILDSPAVDVIKSIPSTWDETIVLPDSEIGEAAVYARRTGDTWFLAVMCGPEAKTIKVPLSFLGEGEYRALLVRDAKDDPAAVKVEKSTANRGDTLDIEMEHGSGFVGRFSKYRAWHDNK
ncbi:MAG: glycoside hydrolase family 97 N-terminal domain-containing protein [Thermoguttaceae bacterium]